MSKSTKKVPFIVPYENLASGFFFLICILDIVLYFCFGIIGPGDEILQYFDEHFLRKWIISLGHLSGCAI